MDRLLLTLFYLTATAIIALGSVQEKAGKVVPKAFPGNLLKNKEFLRYGKSEKKNPFQKDFLRFGRSPNLQKDFMRFGRSDPFQKDFMRFGRDPKFEKDFMRFGRAGPFQKDFMRFGRAIEPAVYDYEPVSMVWRRSAEY